ncbi:MAG: formate--tetrahydrofolate ligase [Christensenellaceae bacterium]|jgi:formate--tetrahydrofolate ligase|nr:formate--tetrahydrofolate ligase [Christensenellaceae bacterium]
MSDIEIARNTKLSNITLIANRLGIGDEHIEPYGKYKAKITREPTGEVSGKVILVTAVNPTPFGEGKTTVSIGLADGISRLGKKVSLALREPSLGPVFGIKGGATGGGYAQVAPMEDINLHFNGDFHAITSANNLISSLIDNAIKHGTANIDIGRIVWRRCVDLNDRALREITCALGGKINGTPRQDGFNITAASEMMATLCLSENLMDLKQRIANIVVAYDHDNNPITVADLNGESAATILLKDAIYPNLVQTLEGTPAIIHGGPFANIAHGCNSIRATRLSMLCSEYTITEAGFGADLGAEKFFDIKCRLAGIQPASVVLVATVRALKYNGGFTKDSKGTGMSELLAGLENLGGHIKNLINVFGVNPVVAINKFNIDTLEEIDVIKEYAKNAGAVAITTECWAHGGLGCLELAEEIIKRADAASAPLKFAYELNTSPREKITAVATKIYGAKNVLFEQKANESLDLLVGTKYEHYPVCIAKTQYSFSQNPKLLGRPLGFDFNVRDVQLRAGAGFLVAVAGDIMLMPGLPAIPAATNMQIDSSANITGLF